MQIENRDSIWSEIARPFDLEEVGLRVVAKTKDASRGLVAPYVDARTVMKRLDEVVGVEGWSDRYEPMGIGIETVFVRCSLTVSGITKEDVGSGHDYKGACSDALKRAVVKFGTCRYLYGAKKVWAQLDAKGAVKNEADVKQQVLSGCATDGSISPEGVATATNGTPR